MSLRSRIGAAFALAAALILAPSVATAAPLHEPHVGTTVECTGQVLWHFVHNQVAKDDATTGTITVEFEDAGVVTLDATKVLSKVRHYDVLTPAGDTLLSASDSIAAGKLVLSHTECTPGTPPPPPDRCVSGDSVTVTWPGIELGYPGIESPAGVFPLSASAAASASLLPGTYTVSLTSTDVEHRADFQTDQDSERWYVELLLGGTSVATSTATDDLPTEVVTATYSGGTVVLPDGADTVVATHVLAGLDYSAAWGSPESVEPTTAVFTCV